MANNSYGKQFLWQTILMVNNSYGKLDENNSFIRILRKGNT